MSWRWFRKLACLRGSTKCSDWANTYPPAPRWRRYNYSRNPHKDHLTTETPVLCDHFWPSPELFLLYSCLSNTRYGDHPLLRPPRLVTTCSQSPMGCLTRTATTLAGHTYTAAQVWPVNQSEATTICPLIAATSCRCYNQRYQASPSPRTCLQQNPLLTLRRMKTPPGTAPQSDHLCPEP